MNMKKIFISLIILCMFLLTSCAAGGNVYPESPNDESEPGFSPSEKDPLNGLEGNIKAEFTQVMKYTHSDSTYLIKELTEITPINQLTNDNLSNYIYIIKEYKNNLDSSLSNWSINYRQDVSKIICSKDLEQDFILDFYQKIESSLNTFEIKTKIEIDYYENLFEIEKELPVNMEIEFTSVIAIDIYLPYQLINQTSNETYIIYVPIKSFLAYKNNDEIKIPLEEDLILNYDSFIAFSNVFN